MADFNQNLWAPWRMEYIRSLSDEVAEEGCFLCRYWQTPEEDEANHVIWRAESTFVVMNRFPYTNGHLLVANADHQGDLNDLDDAALHGMTVAIRQGCEILRSTLSPHGFNIGYNLGRCAGAGLPDHLHAHVVPRWNGDTNFMAVIGDSRVIPDGLNPLWAELVKQADAAGLRS